jgi:hypothetical protein
MMRVHHGVSFAIAIVVSAPLLSSTVGAEAPADPGCAGRIVATFNHDSGLFGASENPAASAGPGYFLRQETAATVHDVMSSLCG